MSPAEKGGHKHLPVMLTEVMEALDPGPNENHLDGTFGAGGYSRAILDTGANLLALDQDSHVQGIATKLGQEYPGSFSFVEARFGNLDQEAINAGINRLDGVVLDIGVSSMQIDQAERGFSFMRDGPLDMRMAQDGPTAGDVINRADGKDITRIIGILGEEKQASRISRAILRCRDDGPIESTLQLSKVIEQAIGHNPKSKIHPATRTFQALRIFINQELRQLGEALFAAERALKQGGRLVVVTFHSLEDRIVKRFFNDRCDAKSGSRHMPQMQSRPALFSQKQRKAIIPSQEEISINPRARSAKLRWAIRTEAAAEAEDFELFGREAGLVLSGGI